MRNNWILTRVETLMLIVGVTLVAGGAVWWSDETAGLSEYNLIKLVSAEQAGADTIRLDQPPEVVSRPRTRSRHIWSKVDFARQLRLADHTGRQGIS